MASSTEFDCRGRQISECRHTLEVDQRRLYTLEYSTLGHAVKTRSGILFLLSLTGIALVFCFVIFRPFLSPVITAVVIAVVFFPVQARMLKLVRYPTLAALLSTLLVILIIAVPAVLIGIAIKKEVSDLYALLDQKSTESGGMSLYLTELIERPVRWLGQHVDMGEFDARKELLGRLQQIGPALLGEAGIVAGKIGRFAVNAVITFFTLFFLFREGRSMRRRAAVILPLSHEQTNKLIDGIGDTIVATVYGGLVVAAVQGTLVGLALWVLDIPSPVLWGVIATVFALIPVVGTATVWVPASLFLILGGHWVQGLILVGWGSLVVGTIDNIIRPYLISGQVRMHTLLIFFACFGGVTVFGFLGLFIGPVVLAITVTLLRMVRDEGITWDVFARGSPSSEQR